MLSIGTFAGASGNTLISNFKGATYPYLPGHKDLSNEICNLANIVMQEVQEKTHLCLNQTYIVYIVVVNKPYVFVEQLFRSDLFINTRRFLKCSILSF